MKTLKYIGLFIASFMFAACAVDEMGSADAESLADNSPVVISISDKNLLPVDMTKTRAEGLNSVMSTVNDLNIRVHKTSGGNVDFFCKSDNSIAGDAQYIKVGSVTHDLSSMAKNSDVQLHLNSVKSSEVDFVEVIANYGKQIPSGTDWDSLKEESSTVLIAHNKTVLAQKTCMMYGKATKSEVKESQHVDPATKAKCKLYDVQLKRSRAMLTLKINGAGLKPGVEITPKTLRIGNAPVSCNLTALGTQTGNYIASEVASAPDFVQAVSLGKVSSEKAFSTLGNHIQESVNPTDSDIPNDCYPIFLFENKQGINANSDNSHRTKYPSGISSVADAKNPKLNFKASYIEIEADYRYTEASAVKIGGTIIYRFFLGKDALQDFNVEGNHYYKLTLNLKGYGGASEDGKVVNGELVVNNEDASWRVDMETTDWGFEKNAFDFDGHFIDAYVPVVGENIVFDNVTGPGANPDAVGGQSWLTFEINEKEKLGSSWANPTDMMKKDNHGNVLYTLKKTDGKVHFRLQPMKYVKNSNSVDPEGQFCETTLTSGKKIYRELNITVSRVVNGATQTQTVSFKQYIPIPLTFGKRNIFMERFEEYDDGIIGYPWLYTNDNLSQVMDKYNNFTPYNYGNVSVANVGFNSLFLSPHVTEAYPQPDGSFLINKIWNEKAKDCAAFKCFVKGLTSYSYYMNEDIATSQGSPANYYALPSEEILKVLFKYCEDHRTWDEKKYGPFEFMHNYDDYWTSTVPENNKTSSRFYQGESYDGVNLIFSATTNRDAIKRVRAIYTVQDGYGDM